MRAGCVNGTDDSMVYPNHRGFSQLDKGDDSYPSMLKRWEPKAGRHWLALAVSVVLLGKVE